MPLSDLTHLWIDRPLMQASRDLIPSHIQVVQAPQDVALAYAELAPVQAIIAGPRRYDAAMMDAAPRLRIIARVGIGVDSVDIAAATERGILVCNTPDGPTTSTAEHTVAMLLALSKRLKEGDANMARGEWGPLSVLTGTEVCGKTLGIIGMGRIGRRVAAICRLGLQMQVLGYSRSLTQDQAAQLGVIAVDLETVIASADFLTLHVPSTPETHHLIDRERITRMKPGAYLLNMGRGSLVDTHALLDAINSGKLAGAGLDVFDPEPLAVESPLRGHPRIIVTPHTGSNTVEGRTRMEQAALTHVLTFFRGARVADVVNPDVLRAER
jgi:D-3-phosphoglycerate dehydrogenase